MDEESIKFRIINSTKIPDVCKKCKLLVVPYDELKHFYPEGTCRLSRIKRWRGYCGRCSPELCNGGKNYYG